MRLNRRTVLCGAGGALAVDWVRPASAQVAARLNAADVVAQQCAAAAAQDKGLLVDSLQAGAGRAC